MKLTNELIRLVSLAGLEQPEVVPDTVFCRSLKESASDPRRDIYIPTSSSSSNSSKKHITAAIVVGMGSNIVTCALSHHKKIPFEIAYNGDGRSIRTTDAEDGSLLDMPEVEDQTARSLVARFHFDNLVMVVIGGLRGNETLHLSSVLTSRPEGCEFLWQTPESEDIWAVVNSAPENAPMQPWVVKDPQNSLGYIRDRVEYAHQVLDIDRAFGVAPHSVVSPHLSDPTPPVGSGVVASPEVPIAEGP